MDRHFPEVLRTQPPTLSWFSHCPPSPSLQVTRTLSQCIDPYPSLPSRQGPALLVHCSTPSNSMMQELAGMPWTKCSHHPNAMLLISVVNSQPSLSHQQYLLHQLPPPCNTWFPKQTLASCVPSNLLCDSSSPPALHHGPSWGHALHGHLGQRCPVETARKPLRQ